MDSVFHGKTGVVTDNMLMTAAETLPQVCGAASALVTLHCLVIGLLASQSHCTARANTLSLSCTHR